MGKNVAVLLVTLLLCIAAIETGLRIFDPYHFRSGWRTSAESQFQKPPASWRSNQLGFHGSVIQYDDNQKVVVLVGDSQVECVTCQAGQMPEDFLATAYRKLGRNVRVFTLGASGYGADQELLALREYFDRGYRADLVLVWQTLGNDMWNAVFPEHSVTIGRGHFKPTFTISNGVLHEPSSGIGGTFCRVYLGCVVQQLAGGGVERIFVSHLPPAAQPQSSSPFNRLPVFETAEDVANEKTHWSIWLKPDSPRKLYGIELFNRIEKAMVSTAASHHAHLTVFDVDRYTPEGLAEISQFDFFKPGDKLVKAKGSYYLAGGEEEYMHVSREVNKGISFMMIPISIPNHANSLQDPHLNARGNEYVMTKLATATAGLLQ